MIIQKFSSKTEADAIDIARKELGPDVVIMNVRTIKKKGIFSFFSSPQVEVTVALEEEGEKQPPKAPAMTALEQLAANGIGELYQYLPGDVSAEDAAALLDEGANYKHISETIGISTATISRVSRCLHYGSGGYRTVLDRLKGEGEA